MILRLVTLVTVSTGLTAADRPNIVWIVGEDLGPELGCYGDSYARTPVLDRFAAEGVRFARAFTHAPVCAPSRSGLVTGRYPTSIGSHHMRSKLLDPPPLFTSYLRKAGYHVAWPGKTDFNFDVPPGSFDSTDDWLKKPPPEPFFAYINFPESHESKIRAKEDEFRRLTARLEPSQRHDPVLARLPPYYPDTSETRRDWARYHDLASAVDRRVGDVLDAIEKNGLAEKTIVFFFGDHGRGLPRGKRWVYDSGIRVPLIVRWPGKISPASVREDLVSFMDLAPTVLSLAGAELPAGLAGRAIFSPAAAPEPPYVFAARDRMDETFDRIRAVRDRRFKYIRNFYPELPYAQRIAYMEEMPTLQIWRRLHAAGLLVGPQEQFFAAKKPVEELYDLDKDPHEIENLAALPERRAKLEELRGALERWIEETGDLGGVSEEELIRRGLVADKREEYAERREEKVRLVAPEGASRFDPAEFRLEVEAPAAKNPFTEVEVAGTFRLAGSSWPPIEVEGFCDSADGSLHILRFSPPAAGEYDWWIRYRGPGAVETYIGRLRAGESSAAGPVVADPGHPRKLIRAGTSRPFFHIGFTAYHLLDPSHTDEEIEKTIAYCDENGFNKVRFLLAGYPRDPPDAKPRPRPRRDGDGEFGVVDISTLPNYGARAGRPNALPAWEGRPHAYDFLRFHVPHWRRADRAVLAMRRRGIVATAIFTIEKQDLPKEYGALTEAERLFYRYGAARLAAFDNVWWDIGNEHNEYRDARWGEAIGRFLREKDPYDRLASAHGYSDFLYPASEWAGYAIVQQYGGPREVREWVLRHRAVLKPFINEEYGYEGRRQLKALSGHGADVDETRRRHWAIAFGGGYATYGDWLDGAWFYEGLPGPGIAARQLKHLRAFFEDAPFNAPFNRMEPRDDLMEPQAAAFCLAAAGRIAVYLPEGGKVKVKIDREKLARSEWFDPRAGIRSTAATEGTDPGLATFTAPDSADWALDIETRP